MSLGLFLIAFIPIFIVAAICMGLGNAIFVSQQKTQIRKMLHSAEHGSKKSGPVLFRVDHTDRNFLSDVVSVFEKWLGLKQLLLQAGSTSSPAQHMMSMLGFGVLGAFLGFALPVSRLIPMGWCIPAVVAAFIPYFLLRFKRKRRLAKFEEQFPEALNFLSRSMRAGHAFSIGLEMLLADAPEPLVSIFKPILSSMQLGASMEDAMHELSEVVPLIDVQFFVSAVLMQQGVGGNLSEILDTMAQIIRERFQVKGQVKAASAHGRVTGLVLCGMPIVVGILMLMTSPEYLAPLGKDPLGRKLLFGSFGAQILGFFVIRKITDIEV